jgi:hypothetical protein
MKAKDLADLLLKTPDANVYIEDYNSPDFDDGYYYTSSINGVQKTPDGIFLTLSDDNEHPRAPSDVPKLTEIRIRMTDGTWFKFGSDAGTIDDLVYFNECKYISTYVGWHEGTYTLYEEGSLTDGYVYDKIDSTGNTSYTTNYVDFVEILTEYNEDTWEVTWQKFKFEEALEFVKHTGK